MNPQAGAVRRLIHVNIFITDQHKFCHVKWSREAAHCPIEPFGGCETAVIRQIVGFAARRDSPVRGGGCDDVWVWIERITYKNYINKAHCKEIFGSTVGQAADGSIM